MEPGGETCKYAYTRRGGLALLWNGYFHYKVRGEHTGRVFWRCVKSSCKVRLSTVNDKIVGCRGEHDHPTEREESDVCGSIL